MCMFLWRYNWLSRFLGVWEDAAWLPENRNVVRGSGMPRTVI